MPEQDAISGWTVAISMFVLGLVGVLAIAYLARVKGRPAADDTVAREVASVRLSGEPCNLGTAVCGLFADALAAAGQLPFVTSRAALLSTIADEQRRAGLREAAACTLREALRECEAASIDEGHILRSLAAGLGRVGELHQARGLAERIGSAVQRSLAFSEIAEAQATAGVVVDALVSLEQCEPDDRDRSMVRVVKAQADGGFFANAKEWASAIEDPASRARALSAVAVAQHRAGNVSAARGLFADVRSVARDTVDADKRNDALQHVALDMSDLGLAVDALAVADDIQDVDTRASVLLMIGIERAEAGLISDAQAIANLIELVPTRVWCLRGIAALCGTAEARPILAEMEALARGLADDATRARALAVTAAALAATGREEDAGERFAEAVDAARALGIADRSLAIANIAVEQASVGYIDAAQETALLSGEEARARVAVAIAGQGNADVARKILAGLLAKERTSEDRIALSQRLDWIARAQARAAAGAIAARPRRG